MAHYIMEWPLLLLCLLAFIHSGSSLKCISCKGTKDCKGNEVTCTGKNDRCSTSVLSISSFFYSNHRITKSCSNITGPSKYTVLSTDRMANLSLQEIYCDSDLCNDQGIFNSAPIVNGLNCYGCISTGKECNSRVRTQLQCTGDQNQCVDIGIIGTFGSTGDTSLKGCGQITACSEDLRYSSQNASVRVQCCDGNFCNDAIEMTKEDKTPNGISCYSCESVNGHGCSPEEVSTVQCHGPLTSCMEVAGIKNQDGNPMPHVIKGCATPAMCNSSVVTLLQNLDRATVQCCSGNLCNNKVTEASLQKDGLPSSETVPPNTGVYNGSPNGSLSAGFNAISNGSIPYNSGYNTNNSNPNVALPGVYNGSPSGSSSTGSNVVGNGSIPNNSGNNSSSVSNSNFTNPRLPPPSGGFSTGSSIEHNAVGNGTVTHSSGYNGTVNTSHPILGINNGSSLTGSNVVSNGSIPYNSGYNSNNSNPSGALPGVYFGSSSGNSSVGSNGSFPYNSGYNTNNSNPNVALPGLYNGSSSGSSSTGSNVVGNGSIPHNSGNNSNSVSHNNFTNPRLPPPSSGFSTGSSIEHNAVGNGTVTHSSGYNGTVNTSHPILGINNGSSLTGSNVVSNGSIPYNSGYNSNNSNPSVALPGVYVGSPSGSSSTGSNVVGNGSIHSNISNPNLHIPGFYNGSSTGYNSGDNSNSFFANGNNTSVSIPGLSSSGTYNNIPDPNSGNGSYIDGSLNPNNVYNPDLINSSGRSNGSEFEDTLSGHNTNGNITQSNKAGLSPVGSSLIILTFVLLKILN